MAKMANNNSMWVSLLEVIAGFLYLWVAFWGGEPGWFSTAGILGPVLWGVGSIGAIMLFLVGLGSFMSGWSQDSMMMAKNAMMWGGIALLALVGNNPAWNMGEDAVILGFVLSALGLWMAMK